MKLSDELKRLDDMTNKLRMYLRGLRVPEELDGVIEYARVEAEAVFDRVSYLGMMLNHGEIPDAEFPGPRGSEPDGDEVTRDIIYLLDRLTPDQLQRVRRYAAQVWAEE